MKKYTKIFVAAMLVLSIFALAGCGKAEPVSPSPSPSTSAPAGSNEPVTSEPAKIDFPTKEINIIVGSGAGGGLDNFSRTISNPVSKILGVPVVVSNVTGGSGTTALTQIMKEPADGYNLYAISVDLVINDAFKKVEYTKEDLIPVLRAQMDQSVFWVPADSKFKTMQDVLDYAKANPGKLNFGMVNAAGVDEVVISQFSALAGIEVTCIPFKSGSESMAALTGGHVDIAHEEPGSAMAMFESGKIRPICVLTEERLPPFPDIPTARELGVDITLGNWRGLFVKKGTPQEIVIKLQDAFKEAMNDEAYKKFEHDALLDMRPGYLSSEDFSKFLDSEAKIYTEILRNLGHID